MLLSGPSRHDFTARPEKSSQSCRTHQDRTGQALTKQIDRQVPNRGAAQWPGQYRPILKTRLVFAQRVLAFGAAIDEVENRSRQSITRQSAQRFDAEGLSSQAVSGVHCQTPS